MRVGRSADRASATSAVSAPGSAARTPCAPKAAASAARSGAGRSTPTGGMDRAGLLVADLAVAAVVDHHDRQRQPQVDGGGQLLDAEHERAVPDERRHGCLRPGERGSDRRRQPVAEGRVARGVTEPPRRGQVEEVHRSQVRDLGAVAGEHTLGGQRRPNGRIDPFVAAAVDTRLVPAGSAQLVGSPLGVSPGDGRPAEPAGWVSRATLRAAGVLKVALQTFRDRRQGGRGVAEQRDVGPAVLVQLRRLDVAADHRFRGDPALPQVRVPELTADDEQAVAVRGRLLQRPQPHGGADGERVRLVEHALAVDRGGHRCAQRLGERPHLGGGVDGAAARDHQRAPGAGEQGGGAPDVGGVGRGRFGGGPDPRAATPRLLQHIHRDLDVHRPRARPAERGERLGDGVGGLVGSGDAAAPAHEVAHRGARVLGLVQQAEVATLGAGGHPGRDDEHRPGLRVGGGGGRHRVGQAGPAGRQHDAGPAGDARVPLRGVPGALLVPRRDRPDPARHEVPVELQIVGAGDAEDGVDAVRGEGLDDGRPAVARAHVGSFVAASTESSSYATCAAAIPVISAWS